MKTLPFLLLLACLLNTALSQPTFSRQVTAVPTVTLPNETLLKIASLAAPEAGHFLRNADKALRSASNFYCTLEDIKKINNSRPEAKALYQAILKKDISAFKRLFQLGRLYEDEECTYGLELAARYDSPQAAWILVVFETLEKTTNAEEREKLRGPVVRRLTETQRADLSQIRWSSFRDARFFRYLIANRQRLAFDHHLAPTKRARIFGLQLAIRYGTNVNIFMVLAFGTSDWDMDSEKIKKTVVTAKGKLPQTYLELLQKIEDGAPEKRDFWRLIVARQLPETAEAFVSDHDTAIVGMQLSLMIGREEAGGKLLLLADTDLKEKLLHAAAALVTNADESENLQQHWKAIEEDFDKQNRSRQALEAERAKCGYISP